MEDRIKSMPYNELRGIRQFIYAIGHIGPGMLNQFITTWILLFLTGNADNVILSGSLVGFALLSGRVIDGIADPLIANWSDNFRSSKWGRRIPFLIIGTLPMVISFNMLWLTGGLVDNVVLRFIWVFFWINSFYFFYTVVVNPYFALLPELAKDNNQRVKIQSFVSLFGILGMGISMGASGLLIDKLGYNIAGLTLSIVCILSMIAPVLTVKVNKDYQFVEAKNQTRNLLKNIKGAFQNKMFINYIVGFCTFFFGFQLIQYNLAFITTILLGLSKTYSSTLFITSVVFALAFIPLYNILIRKLGTTRSIMFSMLSYAVVAVLLAMIPILKSVIPPLPLGIILMAMLGFPYSGLMVIPNVLISEIINDDFKTFEVRREAMFFGVQGLINKLVTALSAFVVGVMHDIFGNTANNMAGVIIIAPIAAVFAIIGFIVIRNLNKVRA